MSNPPLLGPAPDDPGAKHVRVTDQVRGWVADALRAVATNQPVTYDVAFMLTPTPNGPAPQVLVFLQIPSMIVGQQHGHVFLLPVEQATEQTVRVTAAEVMDRLFKARLASALPPADANGAPRLN